MKICKICGNEFSDPKHPHQFLCSRECSGKYRQRIEIRHCALCNKEFRVVPSSKVTHCSIQCFNKRPENQKADMIRTCERCGKIFKRYAGHLKQRFCSRACVFPPRKPNICFMCHSEFMHKHKQDKFCSRQCASRFRYIGHIYKVRPSTVLHRREMKQCEMCGYDTVPQILERHHKDFNHKNNSPSNLQPLCPNCHDALHYQSGNGIKHKQIHD